MKWTEPYEVKQARKRKPITVQSVILRGNSDRFHLYPGNIPTMWILLDRTDVNGNGDVQHFLYATDWENARQVAEERIEEALTPKLKKPRKHKLKVNKSNK